MIKPDELRKKSLEELYKMKRDIEFQRIKAGSVWGRGSVDRKSTGTVKGLAKPGDKTSIQRDLRRVYAKVLTIINEKERAIK